MTTHAQAAFRAEQLRAELTDFWGTPHKGAPLGADLIQALTFTSTGIDVTSAAEPDLIEAHRRICAQTSAAFDKAAVWVAPQRMTQAITAHPLVTGEACEPNDLEAAAPARNGLVYFPEPIETLSAYPVHALAWQLERAAEDGLVSLAVETISTTRLIPAKLPHEAGPTHLATTELSTNSLTVTGPAMNGLTIPFGDTEVWGAPAPKTAILLTLAFWDLRPPQDQEEEASFPQRTKGKAKKGKRLANRRVRIIRESAVTHPAAEPTGSAHTWNEKTLRWEVAAKLQWRCPNPHQHRAIVEAGGTCPKVQVLVKAHTNGPKGRAVDQRRTVRIAATIPPSEQESPA
jgi:hypothetical protein